MTSMKFWAISNEFIIEGNLLLEAMSTTFRVRRTPIGMRLSTLFSEEFIVSKSVLWRAFLSGIGKEGTVTNNFKEILERIGEFIQPVLDAIESDSQFGKTWDPKNGWE